MIQLTIQNFFVGNLVFVEQLQPQIRSIIKHDVLLRCKAVSDEILDIAYIWTYNNMPLLNSNSELTGHVVSIILKTNKSSYYIFNIDKLFKLIY